MKDLLPIYRKMAADGQNFRGLSVLQYKDQIRKLAHRTEAKTMLDYGCGAGDAYKSPNKLHHHLGISRQNVNLYDPSFPQHSNKPQGEFDLVVCSDVLEHIPEHNVDEFVKTLYSHAGKALWVSVCCRPAKKFFPDGVTNLHVTIKDFQWWQDTFREHAKEGVELVLVETL
jgi:2-polyprenyl-3-methyl-5-hydroxy-6-metoxy-1,4-benzoquinol methylase